MTTTMFDSTNPLAIPTTAAMVAEYVDGLYRAIWVANAGRFPNTPKRRIACVTVNTPSDTADFERYDLTPADGPVWHRNMTTLGEVNLWAYTNRSNRGAVEDAMWAAGIPASALSMWIATLDGTQAVAAYRYPVAAVQYTDTGSVDLSIVYQAFGGGGGNIPTGGFMAGLTDAQQASAFAWISDNHAAISRLEEVFGTASAKGVNPAPPNYLAWTGVITADLAALAKQIGAIPAATGGTVDLSAINVTLDAIKATVEAIRVRVEKDLS